MKVPAGGVYKISNRVDGRVYVGSSGAMRKRWSVHRRQLRDGSHPNYQLLSAWELHGEDAFDFIVLEAVRGKAARRRREQFWIEQERALGYGYNARCASGRVTGEIVVAPRVISRAKVAPANAVRTATKSALFRAVSAPALNPTSNAKQPQRRSGVIDRRQVTSVI
jgi:hypothetical protein